MRQMEFNVLRRAQENAKQVDHIKHFFIDKGIDIREIKKTPDLYSDVIKEYSKTCIDTSLYEETLERLEVEFNKLCLYHVHNEEKLTNSFYNIAREIILSTLIEEEVEKDELG